MINRSTPHEISVRISQFPGSMRGLHPSQRALKKGQVFGPEIAPLRTESLPGMRGITRNPLRKSALRPDKSIKPEYLRAKRSPMSPMLPRFAMALLACLAWTCHGRAQGIVLPGAGAVNRSMGGASTAAPIDASGSLYWNPAAISGLGRSELEFGLEMLYVESSLASSVGAGALGPGTPPIPLAGSTRGDSGVSPLPAAGLVYHPDDSPWTFGLGVFVVGGFGANYGGSTTNPILTSPPPNGVGVGPVFSQLQVIETVPTVAYQLTENVSVGFAPTFALASLAFDPALIASPDDSNHNGLATYPSATHGSYTWGAGFQTGIFYAGPAGWNLGVSFKSPQWLDDFRFNATDELGRPRLLKFHFGYPLIASLGTAYTGWERWVFAADVRYIDYHHTPGFSGIGFDAAGALRGLGWDSTLLVSLGVQHELTEFLKLRAGYSYSPNPIEDARTGFNIASGAIVEHALYLGASYDITRALVASVAYGHGFANTISGPILSPVGTLAGTSVTNRVGVDTAMFGLQVKF